MSASAGWGAPSLILLLLSKPEVQKLRQSTSFACLDCHCSKNYFFKLRDSTERKSKDFAIWTGMIETVLRKVYIEL